MRGEGRGRQESKADVEDGGEGRVRREDNVGMYDKPDSQMALQLGVALSEHRDGESSGCRRVEMLAEEKRGLFKNHVGTARRSP